MFEWGHRKEGSKEFNQDLFILSPSNGMRQRKEVTPDGLF